jgi:hypothetical protein
MLTRQQLASADVEVNDFMTNPKSPEFFPDIIEPVIQFVEALVQTADLEKAKICGLFPALRDSVPDIVGNDFLDLGIFTQRGWTLIEALKRIIDKSGELKIYERSLVKNCFISWLDSFKPIKI